MTTTRAEFTAADIASRFELELEGNQALVIRGVGTLASAQADQISFLANARYRSQMATSNAGAIIVRKGEAIAAGLAAATLLIAADPYVAFARVAALFERVSTAKPGIHPSAVVSDSARIAASASIGPHCVIEDGAIIEDGVDLGAHCHVGPDCVVGAHSRLGPRVTLVTRVRLGRRVLIHSGAVLGADGFGIAFDSDHWIKVPQLGGVQVGDDCEIGANTTIDRGALENTV
ncbi:UDP-3-O-(3-hydroxymyristoyl)glucosamine N-acyltransferase, partial [Dokdonella sp.]|uniref:UDP-3-O-(3-hydroxymyristoyl)glucosamine N-acyltransferase n=1 Tax=Dokdonella sp. TaxID=2291710 RepID=UPI003C537ED6